MLAGPCSGSKQIPSLSRPVMTADNVIQISQGWHPLQELNVSSYVRNDTLIAGSSEDGMNVDESTQPCHDSVARGPKMLIMTGPNYSGKSVYLKQVAVTVYMAHIGSFVPCENALIGLTDKIMTRIATLESVSRNQSAFMIDLQQVCMAVKLATSRSLLIIDEFGKGTASADGAGLACAVFEHLLNQGNNCPKVLGATHFHEIFENGYMAPRPDLQFGHMEIRINEHASVAEEQISYLYNFNIGRSMASFGTCCAAMNGIAPSVVQRAEQLIELGAKGNDLAASSTEVAEHEAEELAEAERLARELLSNDLTGDPNEFLSGMLSEPTLSSVVS